MKRTPALLFGMLGLAAVAGACGSETSDTTPATTMAVQPTTTLPPTNTTHVNATATVRVWFLDHNRAITGEEPLYRSVDRTVKPPAVATGALDALFAGPTAAERANGLELILSGATGYSNLNIDHGIASVRLEGGCSSGGSTMTIAGEIFPILRQFASVNYVKIYAPDGTTETPTGFSDSIPACLEP